LKSELLLKRSVYFSESEECNQVAVFTTQDRDTWAQVNTLSHL